jgi:hypothetical protein
MARSTRGEACSVQTISSADGGSTAAIEKSRAPAGGEVGRTEKLSNMYAPRHKLAAFGDEFVVPDQILGSEIGGLIIRHVRIGCRTGPVVLQRSKSSPHALVWSRGSQSTSVAIRTLGSWRIGKPLC